MHYTKGEWKYYHDGMIPRTAVCAEDGLGFFTKEVARIKGDTEEEKDANAHLIATAPEMYEALKEALQCFKFLPGKYAYMVLQIEQALAKVEGGRK